MSVGILPSYGNGSGGGGSITGSLSSLSDVSVSMPLSAQVLSYGNDGKWHNTNLSAIPAFTALQNQVNSISVTAYTPLTTTSALTGSLQTQITNNNIALKYLSSVTGGFALTTSVASLTGQLALDSSVVHDTGNESISGIKSFYDDIFVVNSDISGNGNIFIDNIYSSGVMVVSGGNVISGNGMVVYGSLNPLNLVSELRDDFVAGGTSSNLGWLSVMSGTAAATTPSSVFGFNSVEKAIGVWQLSTGTTNTGRANINLGTSGILFGYADMMQRWRVGIDNLSNSSQRYIIRIGFMDSTTNADATNGAYFEYDEGTAGNFWRVCTANNGARTKTTTAISPQISSFDRLWIYIKPDGSAARFFINETEVNSISTNIPATSGRYTGVGATIVKTVGTAVRNFYVDYFYLRFIGTRS